MLGLAMAFFGKIGGGWIKYLLIAAVLAGGFLYVRNMGVQAERAKWELAIALEQKRQNRVNKEWVFKSIITADEIAVRLQELTRMREDDTLEARNENGDAAACLSTSGVQRLNAIR